MPDFRFLMKVSRPRFWLYLFGPFMIGLAAGATTRGEFLSLGNILFAFYFLFPANLLIYGVNDIFDFETDKLNPKKQEYETLVQPGDRRVLWIAIFVTNLPFVIAAAFFNATVLAALAGFLFFSIFYSAPPVRAKAIPVVDSLFNVLYVFPGIFAFALITGNFPPAAAIAAGGFWTAAMHAYSAIPDMASDRLAGVETVATFLGRNGTHLFCSACYLASALLAFPYVGALSALCGIVYLALILISLFAKRPENIFGIYKRFPIINSIIGFGLFWFVALTNLT